MADAVFDPSVTAQQQQWIRDAIARMGYTGNPGKLTFKTVAEPSCPGHRDYMCTETANGSSLIEIREQADDPTSPYVGFLPNPPRDVHSFFRESIVHEIAHAVTFNNVVTDTARRTLAQCFVRTGATGEAARVGTLADWNPLDAPWEDRIQEAIAEVFKDYFLPEQYRVFDNRTNWTFSPDAWSTFTGALGLTGGATGGATYVFEGNTYQAASDASAPQYGWTDDQLTEWANTNVAVIRAAGSSGIGANAFFGYRELAPGNAMLFVPLMDAQVQVSAEFFETPFALTFDTSDLEIIAGSTPTRPIFQVHEGQPFLLRLAQPDMTPRPVIHMFIGKYDYAGVGMFPHTGFDIAFPPKGALDPPEVPLPSIAGQQGAIGVLRGARR